MCWRKAVEILKLCNTPISIISPFPIFAISLFLISHNGFSILDLDILLMGILVSLFSIFGANLWNHCNDLREDIEQGKKTILTDDINMQKIGLIAAIIFYLCTIIFVFYLSIKLERPIYLFFLIWFFFTWWYSDNIFLKKVIGFRLKDHYKGELLTYSIAWPMFTLSIWLIYSVLNLAGITLALAFFFFGIGGMLLKDLKDITGDKIAGLKTFGVIFLPSQLIRYSCYSMILFYLVLFNPIAVNFLGIGIFIMVLPFGYFLKNTFVHLYRKNWALDRKDLKAIKGLGQSIYSSIIFIGLSSFF